MLGLTQSGLPRMRVASLAKSEHQALAVECRRLAESMLDDIGRLPPQLEALADELAHGWLAAIAAGEAEGEETVGA